MGKTTTLLAAIRKERAAYLFILPSVLLFLLLVLYPMLLSLLISFQSVNLVSARWVGLANFRDILADRLFHTAVLNTFLFVLFLVPTVVFLAFFTALKITPLARGLQTFFRASFYLPVVVSGVVISLIWLWIFNPAFGLLNYLLPLVGMKPVVWLASRGTLYYLMFVVFTFNFGVPLIIYIAALSNIPEDLFEAARMDGASRRTIKWKITFPLLKPTTFFLFVTQTIAVFQTWVVTQLLTNGGPAHSTETIVFQIYINAFWYNQFGRASAMGMVLLVIIVGITLLQKLYAGDEVSY
jgi:multiple sugar transport system permease protein